MTASGIPMAMESPSVPMRHGKAPSFSAIRPFDQFRVTMRRAGRSGIANDRAQQPATGCNANRRLLGAEPRL
jgi:hypothetical protein